MLVIVSADIGLFLVVAGHVFDPPDAVLVDGLVLVLVGGGLVPLEFGCEVDDVLAFGLGGG